MFHMKREEKEKRETRISFGRSNGGRGEEAEAAKFNNKWNNTL